MIQSSKLSATKSLAQDLNPNVFRYSPFSLVKVELFWKEKLVSFYMCKIIEAFIKGVAAVTAETTQWFGCVYMQHFK